MEKDFDRIPSQDEMFELWCICKRFIKEQQISCPETVHQCDWVVMENVYEFIGEICKQVGYFWDEDEDE